MLTVGHANTIGARSSQEDSAGLWFPPDVPGAPPETDSVLAVLADGMGGHAGGAVASSVACATFIQTFEAMAASLQERLETSLQMSNQAISERVAQDSQLNGMGSTLVAAYVDRDGLRWMSVGDSLLYLYRDGKLQRLNDDHSLGRLLDIQAERNQISFEEAKAHRHRNALRSALTGKKLEIIDRHHEPVRLQNGDWILLASDGIATLDEREIGAIIERNKTRDPDDVASEIIAAVDQRNVQGQDNTTLLMVRIGNGVGYQSVPTRVVRSNRIITGSQLTRASTQTPPPPVTAQAGGTSYLRAFGLASIVIAVGLLAVVGGVSVVNRILQSDTPAVGGPDSGRKATTALPPARAPQKDREPPQEKAKPDEPPPSAGSDGSSGGSDATPEPKKGGGQDGPKPGDRSGGAGKTEKRPKGEADATPGGKTPYGAPDGNAPKADDPKERSGGAPEWAPRQSPSGRSWPPEDPCGKLRTVNLEGYCRCLKDYAHGAGLSLEDISPSIKVCRYARKSGWQIFVWPRADDGRPTANQ